jgi:negative regulator of sigma E activity
MTGGSSKDGSSTGGVGPEGVGPLAHGASSRPLQPRDDRETLSALFDGELSADATRFALKRLDHDLQWRETCGRWQLIGDALRGEPLALAPADFATGVVRALGPIPGAGIPSPQDPPKATRASALSRGRWLGGAALAASMAVAAVLVVRPFSSPQPMTAPPAVVQATPASPLPAAPTLSPALAGGEQAAVVAAIAPAAASSPSPAPARPVRATQRARRVPAEPVQSDPEVTAAIAVADPATAAPEPFHPPADDVATRPWPRAVLPDTAAGAFTVGLEGTSPSPSFYPFEPSPAAPATQDESDTSP